ncbi:MAG: HD domain-containing phosphohydrolase [Bacillota bacterium]
MFTVPMWLAEVFGSAILIAITGFLYSKTRERFMAYWLVGWGLALISGSPVTALGASAFHVAIYEAARVVGVHFILRGNCEFLGREVPTVYPRWTVATLIWVLGALPLLHGRILESQRHLLLFPSIAIHAATLMMSGPMFLRSTAFRPAVRCLAGWSFILLGVHVLDYPVFHNLPGISTWAYLLGFLLGMMAGLGTFLAYFDRREQAVRKETQAKEEAQAALVASEVRYRELADLLPETVFEVDLQGNILFANKAAFRIFGYSPKDIETGLNIYSMLDPDQSDLVRANFRKTVRGEPKASNEYTALRKDGTKFPIIIRSTPVIRDGNVIGLRGIIVDITDIKKAQDKMRYLSLHDPLTGLFNRTYFEQQLHKAQLTHTGPAAIVMCDMDGLKLVNDTLGHHNGDRLLIAAAEVVTRSCPNASAIARVGGDEFAVLMLEFDDEPDAVIEDACCCMQDLVSEYNDRHPELPLSISIGYALGDGDTEFDRLFRDADDHMYREKLHHSQSARNSIVQTMMKTLEARDYATEHHAERLEKLVTAMAQALEVPPQRIADLRLLAQFHDIGKVGVSDTILFKPGPLTPKQRREINRHSEIGFRIAQAAPDLAPIADAILKHHEWWDGRGYPLGLKGEEIPLECRILAIADAFDAMTSERPYRRKLSAADAVKELIRCKGTQFDPELVDVFVRVMDLQDEANAACQAAAGIASTASSGEGSTVNGPAV